MIGGLCMVLLMTFLSTLWALVVMLPVSLAWGFALEPYLASRQRSTIV